MGAASRAPARVLAALLAALLLAPGLAAAGPAPPPGAVGDASRGGLPYFLREDPDGGRTLTLLLEDDSVGPYAYTPLLTGEQEVREAGTYTHDWTWEGKPEVTLGVYQVSDAHGLIRLPVVVLEHAGDAQGILAAFTDALLGDGLSMARSLEHLLTEVLVPDQGDPEEEDLDFAGFDTHPTVAAWQVRRVLPGAELWMGAYLAREGASWEVPGGREGLRSDEFGLLSRLDGEDQRLAGVYVEQHALATEQPPDPDTGSAGARHVRSTVTAGAVSPAGRVPLASAEGEDTRQGSDLGQPEDQTSTFTVGVQTPQGFVPLAGLRTDVQRRHHDLGTEVLQTTGLGVFVAGAWTPLAGWQYHAERHGILGLVQAFLAGGTLGSRQTGDAEVRAGAFVDGTFTPLAQAELDDRFAGARRSHQTMVRVGVVPPAGAAGVLPLAAATYEGTVSLLDWATLALGSGERGTWWLVSAGPYAGQLYAPLVGVRFQGEDPGSDAAHEGELALGTFVLSYTRFLPLAAARYASDEPLPGAVEDLVNQGLGNQATDWAADVGSYLPTLGYVSLLRVTYDRVPTEEDPAASDLTVWAAGERALGVLYRGEAPLNEALGDPSTPDDDQRFRIIVGVWVQDTFVPLVRIYHDSEQTTVVLGPDLALP